jgi:lysophospholipase L1-like esterase
MYLPQAPPEEAVLSGARVLWSRPGQLVLSFAALAGLALGAEAVFWPEEAPEEAPAAPAQLSARVSEVLERAEISPAAPAEAPEERRGLVNLLKELSPAAAPAPAVKDAAQGDGGPAAQVEGVVQIEDPSGAMRPFYESLRRTEAKAPGAVTRVTHYGDSVIVADFFTSTARRKLQERFGDAGHGFMVASKPWDYYLHEGIVFAGEHWKLRRVTSDGIADNRFGLGGVTAQTWGPGAWTLYQTVKEGPVGRSASRLQLLYLAQPNGGEVAVEVDGEEVSRVSTRAEALEDRVLEARFVDGPHKVKVVSRGGGEVRVYGAALEREAPGVVYDSLGITGVRAKTLGRIDEAHFKVQLQQRDPHLVILMFGTNESEFTGMQMSEYVEDYTRIARRVRGALPGRSCLVISPPDRAQKNSKGRLATVPLLKEIIKAQREVALREGCAWWSTWEAMGGEDAMVAWYRHNPPLGSGDFTHLTKAGGEAMGLLLYDALMAGYEGSR